MGLLVGTRRALLGGSALPVYYVDATLGNDANAGTSPAKAWQTLHKVDAFAFASGDRVLLKRGEVWTGTTLSDRIATSRPSVTYGAYGSGAKPIVERMVPESDFTWTEHAPPTGVWKDACAYGSAVSFSVIDTADSFPYAQTDNLVNCLANQGQFFLDTAGDVLYIHTRDDLTPPATVLVQDDNRNPFYLVAGADNVTVQDIEFRYGGTFFATTVSNLTVRRCDFNYVPYYGAELNTCTNPVFQDCTFSYCGVYRGGGGVTFTNNGTGGTVEDCLFSYNGGNENLNALGNGRSWGGGPQWDSGQAGGYGRRCLVIGSDQDIITDVGFNVEGASGVTLEYCLSIGCTSGFFNWDGDDNIYYNCVAYDFRDNPVAGYVSGGFSFGNGSTNNTMRNCIAASTETIANSTDFGCIFLTADSQANFDSDYDQFYFPNHVGAIGVWAGVQLTFANWKTNSGQDAASDEADPVFVTPGSDFHLQITSPCRDAGEDVGLEQDYGLVAVPQETNPAIGAYEYVA